MRQYIVDAFTDKIFSGNPAAICILDNWISEEMMKNITIENNLSETAFAVKEGKQYHLRWFTPEGEINLCGHATLACAFVILTQVEKDKDCVVFSTLSGELAVTRKGELFEMDFPAYELKPVSVTPEITDAIQAVPKEVWMGRDLLCILDGEDAVKSLVPDLDKIKKLDGLLLHVTAQGTDTDCVSRTFAPKCGVSEDPVCGSGHCHIIPYWTKTLQKNTLTSYQASRRGGTLYCRMEGDRVILSGKAALYSVAELFIH